MKVTGYTYRLEALKLAAAALRVQPGEAYSPQLWCLAVFFEMYLRKGADATQKDFGPPSGEVVTLKLVKTKSSREETGLPVPPSDPAAS